jgi:hypothetical protein
MGRQPMAFYHDKGLVPTWHLAQQYIERGGRLATLPDIIDARLATEPGAAPWEMYFTTLSAEYVGIGRNGRKIIIVAHGVGPMATLDGIMAAYKHEYADKTRDNRGGRISIEEFRKLEDGGYGEVSIVDYEEYVRRYEYPFLGYIRSADVGFDPLLYARFGGREKGMDYVIRHAEHAENWHDEQCGIDPEDRYGLKEAFGPEKYEASLLRRRATHLSDRDNPFVVALGDAANCRYRFHPQEDDVALAHLLSIGRLMHAHHDGHESLVFDASPHEWGNGCRFVGIPEGADMALLHPGWDPWKVMAEHWDELMLPVFQKPMKIGARSLMQLGDNWFTQYPTNGHSMETWEPECLVTEKKQIGEPVEFQTEIHGYYGFFRYDAREVETLMPPCANAYLMGEPEFVYTSPWRATTRSHGLRVWKRCRDATHHKAMVTFYRIEADTSRRLRRRKDIEGDFETLMRLLEA